MCDRNDISYLSSLPRLEISSNLNNIPNLSDFDIERNITPQINFNYYAIDDFVYNHEIGNLISKDSLSVLHCNIRSLAANFDNLTCLLSDVQYQFDIVGLSEIKFNVKKDNTRSYYRKESAASPPKDGTMRNLLNKGLFIRSHFARTRYEAG